MSAPHEKDPTALEPELRKVTSRHKRPPPHPTRSGRVSCLRCNNHFVSWDLRRNRLCPVCAKKSW